MMASISNYFTPLSGAKKSPTKKKAEKDKVVAPTKKNVPWVEKYRPTRVDDLVFQDEIVAILGNCVRSNGADLPNFLFYGPPGTGKTSAALALCRQLFRSPEHYKQRVLELNASDERGIDVIRTRIKDWARLLVVQSAMGKDAPLKIVILDEADAMTHDAQSALRRTMESETQNTRFILICNYITRIIQPLTSRCSKFRFKPLSVDSQRERLLHIRSIEQVKIDDGVLDELLAISNGDLRRSITLLQSLAVLNEQVTIEDVHEASGFIPERELHTLVKAARSHQRVIIHRAVHSFIRQGFSVNQLLNQLVDYLLDQDKCPSEFRALHLANIFEKISECERRLLDGADELLQLWNLMVGGLTKAFFDAGDTPDVEMIE